jgi:YebC/PmpR family DNA-binding regulatory protein
MSGHSKWSTIKRKKGAVDAKRGKVFTKLIRELTVAARSGGADEESNPQLRTAVQNAKAANMPMATVERAVSRGSGDDPGEVYEAAIYEGYGSGGVAVLVETLSDNKNRTVSEVRHLFNKHGGNLAEKGAVAYLFAQKGLFEVPGDGISEDDLMLAVMDVGAEDIQDQGDVFEILCPVEQFQAVKQALDDNGISVAQASLAWVPQTLTAVEGHQAEKMVRLLEGLEELDDVQKVFSNFDVQDEELEKLLA